MDSSIALLSDLLGSDGPELVQAVGRADEKQVEDIAEMILDRRGLPHLSEEPNAVRPLINARLGTFHARGIEAEYAVAPTLGGLNLLTATDPRFIGKSSFSRAVARALLYCHGLVLEDPIALACHMYLEAPTGSRNLARRFVDAAVITAMEINELVGAQVLTLYWIPPEHPRNTQAILDALRRGSPSGRQQDLRNQAWDAFEALFVDGLDPSLRELWQQVRGGNRSPDITLLENAVRDGNAGLARQFIEILQQLNTDMVVENVLESLAIALDDVWALRGQVDVFAPSALFARLLLAPDIDPSDANAARIRELVHLVVPRLDDLTWQDVVRIRQDEPAFAEWRSHLGRGLDRISALRAAGQWKDARQTIEEELAPGRNNVMAATQRSSFLSRATEGAIAFVLGGLGGALGVATQPAAEMTLAAIGAGTGAGLVAAAANAHAPPEFLLRHYVLFERTSPDRPE